MPGVWEKSKKFLNDTECSQRTEQLGILENIRCPNILTLLQTHSQTSLSGHTAPILPPLPPFPHPDDPHSGPKQWWHPHNCGSSEDMLLCALNLQF